MKKTRRIQIYKANRCVYKRTLQYVTTDKKHKIKWIFHEGDSDKHPSYLHAHSLKGGYRLDALTGEIYEGADLDKPIWYMKDDDLQTLHDNPKFQEFVLKRIEWMKDNQPYFNITPPEWLKSTKNTYRNNKVYRNRKTRSTYFMFIMPVRNIVTVNSKPKL